MRANIASQILREGGGRGGSWQMHKWRTKLGASSKRPELRDNIMAQQQHNKDPLQNEEVIPVHNRTLSLKKRDYK